MIVLFSSPTSSSAFPWGAGRVLVPVNFRLRPDELADIIERAGARMLLVDLNSTTSSRTSRWSSASFSAATTSVRSRGAWRAALRTAAALSAEVAVARR